jgi:hypothetical protein
VTRYVLDASAGVEFLLDTTRGRSLAARLSADAEWWVPEHYYVEAASVLRRPASTVWCPRQGPSKPSQI